MLNRITLMGRLTQDPELRHLQGSEPPIAVVSFGLAVARDYKDKDGNKITDFFDIVAWRKKAEFICKYFRKGQLIYIEGRLQLEKWQDKDGNNRRTYRIVVENCHFTGDRKTQNNNQNEQAQQINDLLQPDNEIPDLPF